MRMHGDIYLIMTSHGTGDNPNFDNTNFDFVKFSTGDKGLSSSTYASRGSRSRGEEDRGHISKYWLGDFDNDETLEVATIRDNAIHRVIEIVENIGHNQEAIDNIALATQDFAGNLLTDDSADFEALWHEHGPSASVAALALILEMPFHGLLDDLYAAVDNGEDLRETVLAVRQSRR